MNHSIRKRVRTLSSAPTSAASGAPSSSSNRATKRKARRAAKKLGVMGTVPTQPERPVTPSSDSNSEYEVIDRASSDGEDGGSMRSWTSASSLLLVGGEPKTKDEEGAPSTKAASTTQATVASSEAWSLTQELDRIFTEHGMDTFSSSSSSSDDEFDRVSVHSTFSSDPSSGDGGVEAIDDELAALAGEAADLVAETRGEEEETSFCSPLPLVEDSLLNGDLSFPVAPPSTAPSTVAVYSLAPDAAVPASAFSAATEPRPQLLDDACFGPFYTPGMDHSYHTACDHSDIDRCECDRPDTPPENHWGVDESEDERVEEDSDSDSDDSSLRRSSSNSELAITAPVSVQVTPKITVDTGVEKCARWENGVFQYVDHNGLPHYDKSPRSPYANAAAALKHIVVAEVVEKSEADTLYVRLEHLNWKATSYIEDGFADDKDFAALKEWYREVLEAARPFVRDGDRSDVVIRALIREIARADASMRHLEARMEKTRIFEEALGRGQRALDRARERLSALDAESRGTIVPTGTAAAELVDGARDELRRMDSIFFDVYFGELEDHVAQMEWEDVREMASVDIRFFKMDVEATVVKTLELIERVSPYIEVKDPFGPAANTQTETHEEEDHRLKDEVALLMREVDEELAEDAALFHELIPSEPSVIVSASGKVIRLVDVDEAVAQVEAEEAAERARLYSSVTAQRLKSAGDSFESEAYEEEDVHEDSTGVEDSSIDEELENYYDARSAAELQAYYARFADELESEEDCENAPLHECAVLEDDYCGEEYEVHYKATDRAYINKSNSSALFVPTNRQKKRDAKVHMSGASKRHSRRVKNGTAVTNVLKDWQSEGETLDSESVLKLIQHAKIPLPPAYELRSLGATATAEQRASRTIFKGIKVQSPEECRLFTRILAATANLRGDVGYHFQASTDLTKSKRKADGHVLIIVAASRDDAVKLRAAFRCRRFRRIITRGLTPFRLSRTAKAFAEGGVVQAELEDATSEETTRRRRHDSAPLDNESYEQWAEAVCSEWKQREGSVETRSRRNSDNNGYKIY